MNWYQVKGLLLWPYLSIQRLRYRNASKLDKAILEANRYSRAFSRFAKANRNSALLEKTLGLDDKSLVMDVGGFDGDWTAAVVDGFAATVHVYEPMPGSLAKMKDRFAGIERVHIHPYGLAASSRQESLALLGPGSSVIRSEARAAAQTVNVDLLDVAEAFASLPEEAVDLFKINIEGAEYEVLQRMLDCDLHTRCQSIMIQYHEFVPGAQAMRRRINRRLAATHRVVWSYKFVWERWELR